MVMRRFFSNDEVVEGQAGAATAAHLDAHPQGPAAYTTIVPRQPVAAYLNGGHGSSGRRVLYICCTNAIKQTVLRKKTLEYEDIPT